MPTNPNDVIRVVCGYTYLTGGTPQSNVLHFVDTGGGGISDAALITGVGAAIELVFGLIRTSQSNKLFYTTYSIQNLTQGLLVGTQPWPTFLNGGSANVLNASQVVGLLRMPTAKPGVQGRVNCVGIPEADVTDSILSAGMLAAIASIGANLLIGFTIAPSVITYTVFNQAFSTFNFPVSAVVGTATRILGRRRQP